MIEKVFFFSFIFFIALYTIVSFYTMVLLKEKRKDVAFFDVTFTNYRSLKKLSKEDEKYNGVYKLLLICTFAPIVIFVSFFIYSILTF